MTTTFNLSSANDASGDCFVLVRMEIIPSEESEVELTEGWFSKLVREALESFMGAYGTGIRTDILNFYTETGTGIIKIKHGLVPMLRAALTLSSLARFTILKFSPSLMSLAIDMD